MRSDVVKVYRIGRRVKCFIRKEKELFAFCTGKPSDKESLCWFYSTLEEAEERAKDWIEDWKQLYKEISGRSKEDWE